MQIEAWVSAPNVTLLAETQNFVSVLSSFLQHPRIRGPLVHDARIAALCAVHGVDELLTLDRDFQLFPSLSTRNPFE